MGPLVKSVQYPYIRRNLHRIVIADTDSLRISDTVRSIVEQRLRKAASQRAAELTAKRGTTTSSGSRPHASGILLSNAEAVQQQLGNKS